jgi:CBS domain-containing protein
MQLREVMTKNVESMPAEATIQEAAGLMAVLEIGFLPVTEANLPVGVVTDRDITIRAVAHGRDPKRTPVRDVMTSDVETMPQDQDVAEAARLMEERQIRRLLVEDINRRIVGVVTLGDLAVETGDRELGGEALEKISEHATPNR